MPLFLPLDRTRGRLPSASSCWLAGLRPLRPDFLEASLAQGDWASEDEHAWREADFPPDSAAQDIVRAAARVAARGSRAFENWQVARRARPP